MKNFIKNKFHQIYQKALRFLLRSICRARYQIEVINSESLENIDPKIGTLFLASHPSNVDAITIISCLEKTKLSQDIIVWSLDFVFNLPYMHNIFMRDVEHVHFMKVPNINDKRVVGYKKKLYKLFCRTVDGLYKRYNYLIFPSGKAKVTPREEIGGNSATHHLLQQCPNANIVLVRIQGQWGSRFSWAAKRDPKWKNLAERYWGLWQEILKMLVFNFLFFIPKRKLTIEFLTNPSDFPRLGSRHEINRYLEHYYNKGWSSEGEPVSKVPNYFWKNVYISHEPTGIPRHSFNLNYINKKVKNKIFKLLANKAQIKPSLIHLDAELKKDLGFDSLEITEILIELEKEFKIKKLVPDHVPTVGSLIACILNIPIQNSR
jgi:long-chain-fatty-acid--[acyl-carrier-protein] ligase